MAERLTISKRLGVAIEDHWQRPLMLLSVALIALFALYWDTVSQTVAIWWRSETYSHGMVIIPFCLYMIWTNRSQLAPLRPVMSLWGVIAMIPGVMIWLLGGAVNVLVLQQLALLWLIWSIVTAVLGARVVREMLFPLAFLFFAVPLGEGLIPFLMDFTAVFTINALQLTGIPVYWEGLYFTIPSGDFEVAKACSGVRYLFASIALGCLFAYINYQSYWRRAVFIGIAVILPLLANGLRAYGIVMIAYLSDMEYAVGFDHLVYGWLFFGIVMFILFFIGAKWREAQTGRAEQVRQAQREPSTSFMRPSVIGMLVFLLIAGPLVELRANQSNSEPARTPELGAPAGVHGWSMLEEKVDTWGANFHGATAQLKQGYAREGVATNLFMAFYLTESQDAELINAINRFYDFKEWTRVSDTALQLRVPERGLIELRELVVKSGNRYRTIWYWYDIGGYRASDVYVGKLLQAWQRLSGQSKGDAAIAIMAEHRKESRERAHEGLRAFLADMYAGVEAQLAHARGDGNGRQ